MDSLCVVGIVITVISFVLSFKSIGLLPWSIDFFHLLIVYFQSAFVIVIIFEIVALHKYDIIKLLFINIMFMFMVLGMVFYGMCPLTILYNKVTNQHKCTPFLWKFADRFDKQRYDAKVQYYTHPTNNNDACEINTRAWLTGQVYPCLTIIALNVLFFIRWFTKTR